MAMLIDSLGSGAPEHPYFSDQPALPAPQPLQALPPLPRHGAADGVRGQQAAEAPPQHGRAQPHAPQPASTTTPTTPASGTCQHLRATAAGSNQHFRVVKCRDCGHILERVRPHHNVTWRGSNGFQRVRTCLQCGLRTTSPSEASSASSTARPSPTTTLSDQLLTPAEAWHVIETFANAMSIKLQQVGPQQAVPAARLQEALRLTIEQSALWSGPLPTMSSSGIPQAQPAATTATPMGAPHGLQSPQGMTQTSAQATASPGLQSPQGRTQTSAQATASPALQSPQGRTQTSEQATASPGLRAPPWTPNAYPPSASPTQAAMVIRGADIVTFGRFKGKPFRDAWMDAGYRSWVMSEVNPNSHRGLKQLNQFFLEYKFYLEAGNPAAFMATNLANTTATETDLIAILDTGCNQSCHGERWLERYAAATNTTPAFVDKQCPTFRGINGTVRTTGTRNIDLCLELLSGGLARGDLRSTEIANSDAPLLISLQAQRSLGLIIDIAAEVAHSQALGADLKLVIKDGLLGLRLLPAVVAEDAVLDTTDDFYDDSHDMDDPEPDRDANDNSEESDDSNDTDHVDNGFGHEVGYMAIDASTTRTMSKQQGEKLDAGIRDVTSKDHHLWNQLSSRSKRRRHALLPKGCRTFLLEVFAGMAMLSTLASTQYGFDVSSPIDIRYDPAYDLTTASGRKNVDFVIERDDPYIITFSPVCTPWSPWMRMMPEDKLEDLEVTRSRWRPVLKWIAKVTRERLARGRQVLIEHPWGSEAWNSTELHRLLHEPPVDALTFEPLQAVRADQCQFGLRDRRSGLPHLKPTGFATATEAVKYRLNARCPGNHYHQVLEGGTRCKEAQDWPPELCTAILDGFVESLDAAYTKAAFPAEADFEDNPDYNTLSTIPKHQILKKINRG